MKWYTVILHVENHVSPVQYMQTRAETPEEAAKHAEDWCGDMNRKAETALIFEGKLERVSWTPSEES